MRPISISRVIFPPPSSTVPMSVIGDFTVPSEAFALEGALGTVPEMTVEADRLASHSPREVFPFLWATGGDVERFRESLEDDPTVTDVDIADESDDAVLYRLEWSEDFCDLVHDMVDHHAAITEARARDEQWHLRLRFADESMVSEFQTHFRESGRHFEVRHLSQSAEPRQRTHGLTAEQHDTLVAAVEGGYYRVPRTISAAELSDRLGVSANAVSQRLRRGTEALVRNALKVGEDESGRR